MGKIYSKKEAQNRLKENGIMLRDTISRKAELYDKIINPNIDGRTYRQRPTLKAAKFLQFLFEEYNLIENVSTSVTNSYITTNGICKRINNWAMEELIKPDYVLRQFKRYEELGFMERICYYKSTKLGVSNSTSVNTYNVIFTEKFYNYFLNNIKEFSALVPNNYKDKVKTFRINLNKQRKNEFSKASEINVTGKAIKVNSSKKIGNNKPVTSVEYREVNVIEDTNKINKVLKPWEINKLFKDGKINKEEMIKLKNEYLNSKNEVKLEIKKKVTPYEESIGYEPKDDEKNK